MGKRNKLLLAALLSVVLYFLISDIKDYFIIMAALFIERLLDN